MPYHHCLAFFPGIGSWELLVIFLVLLLLFGGKKLPELARGLGKSLREFKQATREIDDGLRSTMEQSDSSDKVIKPTMGQEKTKAEEGKRQK